MGGIVVSKPATVLGVLLLIAACDSGGAPAASIDEGDGGPVPIAEDAGRDAGAVVSPGPIVQLLSPVETSDPASADVVVGTSLNVMCKVEKNPKGGAVDPAKVAISIYAAGNSKAAIVKPAASSGEPGVYVADVTLSDVPHGEIRVECAAADTSSTVKSSAVSVSTLYDRGPEITFLNPMEKGFVSANIGKEGDDVLVSFKVVPRPLTASDTGAEIGGITVTVGGKPVTSFVASTTEENAYSFGVDFNDKDLFAVIPKTLDIVVTANNKRTAHPSTVSARLSEVGVDSAGPTITMQSPVAISGSALPPVVSGKVDVVLELKDDLAGVDPASVQVQIETQSGGKKTYPTMVRADGRFVMSFQTSEYPGLPGLALTLIAKDKAGNETKVGRPIDVDPIPPWISLAPPPVRERNTKRMPNECSASFAPLGSAVKDGQITDQAYRVRALIWDRPLVVSGQAIYRYAMIDNTTTQLFVQHDNSVPLIIDSDKDGVCDSINAAPAVEAQRPTALQLTPIAPTGPVPRSLVIVPGPTPVSVTDFTTAPVPSDNGVICNPVGGAAPVSLCSDSEMSHITKHSAQGTNPVVYGYTVAVSGIGCTGSQYFAPRAGWACLAVQAKDNAGNLGISMPIRVCSAFAPNGVGPIQGNCGGTSGQIVAPPPSLSCTDGCSMPDWFLAQPTGPHGAMPTFINLFE